MAVDKKISQLTSGAPAQAGDEYVVARSGANYKLTLTNIAASMPPIGATTPNTGAFTTLSASGGLTLSGGNLAFTGTAQRITGDFSDATHANRVIFQSNVTNGATNVGAMPNGTATQGQFLTYGGTDPANTSFGQFLNNNTEVSFRASAAGTGSSLPMTFWTGGSEKVRIDTSGNVGIGTANTPSNKDTVTPKFIVNGSGVAGSMQVVRNTTPGAGGGILELTATRGTDVNSYTVLQSGDGVGSVVFGGADGNEFVVAASIQAQVDGTPGDNDMPGRLIFNTTADGASSTTERMRIDSSGNVGIGGTADAFAKTRIAGTLPTGSNTSAGFYTNGTVPSGSTADYLGFWSSSGTQATAFTLSNASHFYTTGISVGAGSTVTNQYGFRVDSTVTAATNNYGFYSAIASGSNRWNFYAAGTAQNYFAGDVGIGTAPSKRLHVANSGNVEFLLSTTSNAYSDIFLNTWGLDRARIRAEASNPGAGSGTGSGILSFWIAKNPTMTEAMRITADGEVYIAGTADQGAYNLQCNGTGVWGAGAYVNGSDERLKDDITTLNDGLSVVSQLRPVTFKYKPDYSKDQNVQTGFIAQELQTALEGKDYLDGIVQAGPNHLNVAYQSLIPILTKAIQEQQAMIDELKAKVAALETK